MSEDPAATAETTPESTEPQEGEEQQEESKTFDAEYVKKLRDEAAKYRTEAKANSEAARKLAEIEEANQTEAERQAARLAEAEKRAQALEVKASRAEVASETGVPAAILAGPEDSTPEAIKAFADEVIAYMEKTGKPRPPRRDANQGRQSDGTSSTADQFSAAIGGAF